MGKKIKITTEQEARAYLRKVLNSWLEFTDTHKPLKQAIEIILQEKQHNK